MFSGAKMFCKQGDEKSRFIQTIVEANILYINFTPFGAHRTRLS
jgi:hypothetical protein